MVLFHLIVDLNDFFGYSLNYMSGFWYYEGKLSAILFMTVAGISSTLHRAQLKQGSIVLAWGMLITAVTYLYNPETYVRFGILHLLGTSMLLFRSIRHLSYRILLAAGLAIIAAGQWLSVLAASTVLLLPFGITPPGFVSIDYYPLLPWSGLFFCGAALGKILYREKRSLLPPFRGTGSIARLGRHSLLIYLTHQPILLALLFLYHRS